MADRDLARRVEALSPAKQALLAARLKGSERHPGQPPPLTRRPADQPVPLSFTQERLWLLHTLDVSSSALCVVRGTLVDGPLDPGALRRALDGAVARHEALRTTVAIVDGEPRQVVGDARPVSFVIEDLTVPAGTALDAVLASEALREARRPFDLGADLMLRARLLRLGPGAHALLLSFHHIAADGWATEVLFRELGELYAAAREGREPALAPLPIQPADHAVWQRALVAGGTLGPQIAYWRRRLGGRLPQLPLPTDRPRPPARSFRGGRESRLVSRACAEPLTRLCALERASLFMLLLAALETLLHRYSREDDIAVTSPVAGRDRPELAGVVGCLINDVVLRADLSGNPSFRALLHQVREIVLEARANQDVPFEHVLAELSPTRDRSHAPLAQVRLTMHDFERRLDLPGLATRPIVVPRETALFDLTLFFRHVEAGIELTAEYDAGLFDAARIRETLAQMETLLEQVAADPDVRIQAISLVTPSGRAVLPDPTAPLDAGWAGGVHEVFSAQAARRPGAIAVSDGAETLTYAQVEARSNQLAHAIRAAGLGAEAVVAVYAHRRAALVWALLGVLKAGAAFTILDPAYPDNRLLDCLDAARPRGWIEVDGARPPGPDLSGRAGALPFSCRVGPGLSAHLARGASLDDERRTPPNVAVGPDALALVAFTSGSTGRPKGVLGRHGSLSHFLPWQREAFALGPDDRFSMLSGLAHDPLQRDIFTALWVGAAVCVPDPEQIGRPGWLARWMACEGVTVTNLTPAMLKLLSASAGAAAAGTLVALRHAFVIGEALTRRDVADLARLAPRARVVNLYGCTETQRALGSFVVPADPASLGKEVLPIGPGMPGCQVLVLTRDAALAGIGEAGEIHIRSPHLARGYLDDEALTASRFIVSPFTGDPRDRLYRTGDIGRFAPDGTIEFLGRQDDQVNVRGFRIEAGEVETLLREHPAVQDAVVAVRATGTEGSALVAYVVTPDGPVAAGDLRGFLEARLPAYMVPAVFVRLPELPRSPSGKVDRSALPAPDTVPAPPASSPFVAPRTSVEEALAAIWQDLLGVERIGVHDNFFDRGGHSLLVVRLLGRVRDDLGVDLPARVPFERPTVEGLALAIVSRLASGGEDTGALLGQIGALSEEDAARILAEDEA